MTVKDRRAIFHHLKDYSGSETVIFFPRFGFTFGEFAVWHTLMERKKSRKKKDADV
jgi:hypothetical protein